MVVRWWLFKRCAFFVLSIKYIVLSCKTVIGILCVFQTCSRYIFFQKTLELTLIISTACHVARAPSNTIYIYLKLNTQYISHYTFLSVRVNFEARGICIENPRVFQTCSRYIFFQKTLELTLIISTAYHVARAPRNDIYIDLRLYI